LAVAQVRHTQKLAKELKRARGIDSRFSYDEMMKAGHAEGFLRTAFSIAPPGLSLATRQARISRKSSQD